MHVVRHDPARPPRNEAPIMTGEVYSRPIVGPEQSQQERILLVQFEAGGRNKLHTHSFDQVLYVTQGEGTVATEHESVTVRAGDTVVIPAGERHWHGANDRTAMSHLAIGGPGQTQIVGD